MDPTNGSPSDMCLFLGGTAGASGWGRSDFLFALLRGTSYCSSGRPWEEDLESFRLDGESVQLRTS